MGLHCRFCGCSTDRACAGGCHWVSIDPPICSACVEAPAEDDDVRAGDWCPAAATPAAHKPIFISATRGYCAACRQPFFAAEEAA